MGRIIAPLVDCLLWAVSLTTKAAKFLSLMHGQRFRVVLRHGDEAAGGHLGRQLHPVELRLQPPQRDPGIDVMSFKIFLPKKVGEKNRRFRLRLHAYNYVFMQKNCVEKLQFSLQKDW
jgi:hypothetical protein